MIDLNAVLIFCTANWVILTIGFFVLKILKKGMYRKAPITFVKEVWDWIDMDVLE